MNFYSDRYNDPKANAQDNLGGRTHYVDDGTLRFHHSRILDTRVAAGGLLFCLIESMSLDMHNTRRGFRYAIFDVFGNVISRVGLDESWSTKKAAAKALAEALPKIDAKAHTLAAIKRQREANASELADLAVKVKALA